MVRKIAFGIVGCVVFSSLQATVIRVPADSLTIQGGLNGAGSGDTVLVSPGTHYENISCPATTGIVLLSDSGAAVTIIDGSFNDRVIANVSASSVIDGFTIRNGLTSGDGSGIYSTSNSVKIVNCKILSNQANNGGGIYISGDSSIVENCGILSNTATANGGGVCLDGTGSTMNNCKIESNTASTDGGGAYITGLTLPLSGNYISGNMASNNGGGIYVSTRYCVFSNDTFINNSAMKGGGIYVAPSNKQDSLVIDSAVVTNNMATSSGGGIYISYTKASGSTNFRCRIENNEISGNTVSSGSGGGIFIYDYLSISLGSVWNPPKVVAQFDIHNNIISNNSASYDGGGVHFYSYISSAGDRIGTAIGMCRLNMDSNNFSYNNSQNDGGGMFIHNWARATNNSGSHKSVASVELVENTVQNCFANNKGGGCYIYEFFPSSSGNDTGAIILTNNSVKDCRADSNAGLYVELYSTSGYVPATISASVNTLQNNTATSSNGGGYLYSSGYKSTINFTTNTIAGNDGGGIQMKFNRGKVTASGNTVSNNDGDYGGLYIEVDTLTFTNNVVEKNTATTNGGGLHLNVNDKLFFTNNLITGNSANSNGAGIFVQNGPGQIQRNTFVTNIGAGVYLNSSASPTISANAFVDNDGTVKDSSDGGEITNNNLYYNTYQPGDYELYYYHTSPLNAIQNYWLDTDTGTIAGNIYGADYVTISPFRGAPNLAAPYEPSVVDSVTIFYDSAYTIPFTDSASLGDTLYLQLTGNSNSSTNRDYAVVMLKTSTDTITVALPETDVNSGIYRWWATIEDSSNDLHNRIRAGLIITATARVDSTKSDSVIFKDTDPPSVPVLVSPVDGAYISDSIPTFVWHTSIDVHSIIDYYILEYADNPSFASMESLNVIDTTYTPFSGLLDTTYYWKVKAVDIANNKSDFSEIWDFEIDTYTPDAPTLLSPSDNSWFNDTTIVFEWSAVTKGSKTFGKESFNLGAKSAPIRYILQIDTTDSFTSLIIADTTQLTKDTVRLGEGRYYWRVETYDLSGNNSFSESWHFGIDMESPGLSGTTIWKDTLYTASPIPVTSTITDGFAVVSPTLYYRTNLDTNWVGIAMSKQWISGKYKAEIPSQTSDTRVEYYLEAQDSILNIGRDPQNAPDSVYSFVVRHGSGVDLIVDGTTETSWGECTFRYVGIINGGVLNVLSYNGSSFAGKLTIYADSIFVSSGSQLKANRAGYRGGKGGSHGFGTWGEGPGGGGCGKWDDKWHEGISAGGGGGYGGKGKDGGGGYFGVPGGSSYGDAQSLAIQRGSGGGEGISWTNDTCIGYSDGGNGGGAINLNASKITIEGQIAANAGAGGGSNGGGGSGGGVLLRGISLLSIHGSIAANGRSGYGGGYGDGGGGRIKIFGTSIDTTGSTITASPNGTVYIKEDTVGVETETPLPKVFGLSQNYPNPATKTVTISYQLPQPTEVSLKMYDVAGKLVTIVVDEKQNPGYYNVVWNGRDATGKKVASGIYFYRLQTPSYTKAKKLILVE